MAVKYAGDQVGVNFHTRINPANRGCPKVVEARRTRPDQNNPPNQMFRICPPLEHVDRRNVTKTTLSPPVRHQRGGIPIDWNAQRTVWRHDIQTLNR